MNIGSVIKKYRKEIGITQEEMANRLGVTTPAVNKWENGNSNPDIELLAPIARLLHISLDTLLSFHETLSGAEIEEMIREMKVLGKNMEKAAEKGFINATDCADYLTKKGVPFRTAYRLTGELVSWCEENDKVLSEVPLEKYKEYSPLFEDDIYSEISLSTCIEKRISEGSTSKESVEKQISYIMNLVEEKNNGQH